MCAGDFDRSKYGNRLKWSDFHPRIKGYRRGLIFVTAMSEIALHGEIIKLIAMLIDVHNGLDMNLMLNE